MDILKSQNCMLSRETSNGLASRLAMIMMDAEEEARQIQELRDLLESANRKAAELEALISSDGCQTTCANTTRVANATNQLRRLAHATNQLRAAALCAPAVASRAPHERLHTHAQPPTVSPDIFDFDSEGGEADASVVREQKADDFAREQRADDFARDLPSGAGAHGSRVALSSRERRSMQPQLHCITVQCHRSIREPLPQEAAVGREGAYSLMQPCFHMETSAATGEHVERAHSPDESETSALKASSALKGSSASKPASARIPILKPTLNPILKPKPVLSFTSLALQEELLGTLRDEHSNLTMDDDSMTPPKLAQQGAKVASHAIDKAGTRLLQKELKQRKVVAGSAPG